MVERKNGNKAINKKVISKKISNKLTEAQFLRLRINHIEIEKIKAELSAVSVSVDNLEMQKQRAILLRDDLKNKRKKCEEDHAKFIDDLRTKHGLDIKGKSINPETYEIVD